ncbi:Zinc-regulated transporter 1 [Podosphaera aphanis]|nr:Zinc-regulated transporter 1 [Podosphaera aphanis]
MATFFDPTNVNLVEVDPTTVICFLNRAGNEYNGMLEARISAFFVILCTASLATLFPVVAAKVHWLRINIHVYLFVRYFGAGVIIATAFIHLLDPAYAEIGPQSCVGMTGHWAEYSWCPAIILTSVMLLFLLDFGAEQYVIYKFGCDQGPVIENVITTNGLKFKNNQASGFIPNSQSSLGREDADVTQDTFPSSNQDGIDQNKMLGNDTEKGSLETSSARAKDRSFLQQITSFLILEFGVIFHSVIIGLNLGTSGEEFKTLYIVLVFHQAFEGLGIGARMSTIPFPMRFSSLPWILCAGYGLTTPIAIAIGVGLRETYTAGSFTANVVSGVLDAISAGILIYTGLVELLAKDFLFNKELTGSHVRLTCMIVYVFFGIFCMSLLGKWA